MASILDELKNKYPESEDMGKANNIAEGVAAIPESEEVPEEATGEECRAGNASDKYISPKRQTWSVFYGLAAAAGDTTQKTAGAFGTYTDSAKTAIKNLIGVDDIPDWESWVEITENNGTISSDKTFNDIMTAAQEGKAIRARLRVYTVFSQYTSFYVVYESVSYGIELTQSPPYAYFDFVAVDSTAANLETFRVTVAADGSVTKSTAKHVALTS